MKFIAALAFSNPRHALDLARAADALAWDALAISDHLVYPAELTSAYPYSEDGDPGWDGDTPWPDPWVTIAAMAAATHRLRFMTNVFILPLRNPVLVAKAVGTAALLSNDRVALGIGVGWMREEFELAEQSFGTRGRRTDEAIAVLRGLWSGEMFEFHGRHYDFAPVRMTPAPRASVPILVGGVSEAALRRAAALGDGWISVKHRADELVEIVARLTDLRTRFGRADQPFQVVASPVDVRDVDGYKRLADVGVTAVATNPWMVYGYNADDLQAKKDALQRFSDEIIVPAQD